MPDEQTAVIPEAEAAVIPEAAKVKFCDKSYDLDNLSYEFAFGNGETLEIKRSEISDDIWNQLALHGVGQKGGDSFAGLKGDFVAGVANCRAVLDALRAGAWGPGRGDGEGKPKIAELAEAMVRIKGLTLEVATEKVVALDDEKRKTLRAHPQVKAMIATQRAEKANAALAAATATPITL